MVMLLPVVSKKINISVAYFSFVSFVVFCVFLCSSVYVFFSVDDTWNQLNWLDWFLNNIQVWITQFYLQATHHTCLYRVVRQREPREDERLSWPCWLTYSGRFTHINGYPSAAGPVQTSESLPVRDRRSTTEPPNQLDCWSVSFWA